MSKIIESDRLAAVISYQVLDTPPETDFDDLVKLATQIFNVPISTVTILDANRQWFKALVGLDVWETARDISFCTHTIKQKSPFVVEDTLVDGRFRENSLVVGSPYLRFYAAIPLINVDGLPIGTFSIMDKVPRKISKQELRTLKVLANQAMKVLELRREVNHHARLVNEVEELYSQIAKTQELWKLAMDAVGDGVWDWNLTDNSVFYGPNGKKMLGFKDDEIKHNIYSLLDLIHEEDKDRVAQNMEAYLMGKLPQYAIEFRVHTKQGRYKWILSRGMVIERDQHGAPTRMVGTHSDITQAKQSEELIWQQANFDHLTELPNRRLFLHRLGHEIERAKRYQSKFSLLFIDLDGFKTINDTYGHQEGDILLKGVAKRIKRCMRKSDTFARLAGDEFIIILSDIQQPDDANRFAEKIIHILKQPFMIHQFQVTISVSIGIAHFPDHGDNLDTLISHADTAMYTAKAQGKNCWAIYALG
ncbi:diguanylate cyclase [Methylobacillus caricis]|uniref:bifunctional diguanylate cyclase/phosphodiesterase n=1 Tax=Methylobacillus caricis TaxID=1971611 RepID=UPI001D0003F5|nr:diguanylate cyclase [Methylobacillus caricis]MCB5187782.1 diguanylate cyclase [Methylobacillus caricis]